MKTKTRTTKTQRISVTVAKDIVSTYSQMATNSGISLSRLVERALFSFAKDYLWTPREEQDENTTPVRQA